MPGESTLLLSAEGGALGRLILAGAAGAVLTLAMDRLVRPGAPGLRRVWPAALIAAGTFGLLFGVALLAFGRPLFACALALAAQMLVVQVSNAKFRALREPFVFTDFGLFSQALRHPRLYLPFLGVGRAVAASVAFALAIYLGLRLEPGLTSAAAYALVVMAIAAGLLAAGARFAEAVVLDPVEDLRRLGLFPSLWLYWIAQRRQGDVAPAATWHTRRCAIGVLPVGTLPDLVAVESESFFDARRLHPGIRADVLARFDELGRQSVLRGRLAVPAWGANTMRTEFAFLTGLGETALGAHRFNPYRLAARAPLPALPACLRALGYRTVCIHPHPAGFFERNRVMPNLGFDEFIDLGGFEGAARAGPYIADAAVGRKIAEVLEQADGPIFVFAITMENHGPLHLERATGEDAGRLYSEPPPRGCEDLTVYLRHLLNADRMIGDLREMLTARARESVLCFFGDHVPSMPNVYDAVGLVDGRTDYLVWHSRGGAGEERDLAADQLGAALVETALAAAARGGTRSPAGGEPSQ